jgi:hypothetical protein
MPNLQIRHGYRKTLTVVNKARQLKSGVRIGPPLV